MEETTQQNDNDKTKNNAPSILARYTTASIFVVILSTWARLAFPPHADTPGLTSPMHGPSSPASLTAMYLVSLPLLRSITERYLSPRYDMKLLLTESMMLTMILSMPPIIVASLVGIVVSLLQALTQVQEQTLSFAIKLNAVEVTIVAMSGLLGSQMLD